MPVVSLTEWNQFLQKCPNAHLLQTGEWGELKSAFGWDAVRIIDEHFEAGIQILFRKLPLGYTIAYAPKGPVGAPRELPFWSDVDQVSTRHKAIFLKIELDGWESPSFWEKVPQTFLRWAHPLRASPHNIQPPRTLIVEIKDSEEAILARMKQKTRYNIRLAEKKGVTVRPSDDIESFHRMMRLTGSRDGFGVHALEYYRRAYNLFHPKRMAELFVAEYEGKPLAALFVARNGNRAYYLYGASTDEERSRMPAYLLQWQAIRWARLHGCEEYDLWGVPDEDEANLEANFEQRNDGLWGVYRFKRGFGGQLKRAPQAMDHVYKPFLYWAYLRFIANRQ